MQVKYKKCETQVSAVPSAPATVQWFGGGWFFFNLSSVYEVKLYMRKGVASYCHLSY